MAIDPGEIRARLTELDWGRGLTREEIRRQAPDLAGDTLDQLPPSYRFPDAGSVMSYLEHILEEGVVPEDVRDVVGDSGEPRDYGDAPTGQTIVLPNDPKQGVGSGAGSGYTGSDSLSAEGNEGVDYTDVEDSHAPIETGEVVLPSDVDPDDPDTKPGPVERRRAIRDDERDQAA